MNPHTPSVFALDFRSFVEKLAASGAPPIYTLPPAQARQVLEDLQGVAPQTRAISRIDHILPVGPRGETSIRIFRPSEIAALLPTVVYFHGGGWILGSQNTHDHLMQDLSESTNAAFVFVNFTPSPESQYPDPIEQAYAVVKYIAEDGLSIDLDPARIAVAGDSAGGNMAIAVALLAKERNGPKLLHQALFYPVTDASMSTDSYNQFSKGPWLEAASMEWFWNAYAPKATDRARITVSPVLATPADLSFLPPATIVTAENDVLRDEGETYAHLLMQADVDVVAVRYSGTIHDFLMLNPLMGTSATRSAIALVSGRLREALGNESDLMGKHMKRFI